MEDAKIGLSEEEVNLVTDAGVILTKNAIIDKVYQLFGNLSTELQVRIKPIAKDLDDVMDIPPKISRGESYLELPYVILDYPRYFRPHDIFAIRTMFWWGNFFSMTLHLKGNFRENYHQRIIEKFREISDQGFFAGIGTDEWEHHFGEDNYISVEMIEADEWQTLYNSRDFTKIALKFQVSDFNKMEEILPEAFDKIIGLLKN
jgi:hypothetical protein